MTAPHPYFVAKARDVLRAAGGDRVVVRPSGTEPKLKCYLESIVPVGGGDLRAARAAAKVRVEEVKADLASIIDAVG